MTLKLNRVLEVVEVHVHQAKCSGLWVVISTNFSPYLAVV